MTMSFLVTPSQSLWVCVCANAWEQCLFSVNGDGKNTPVLFTTAWREMKSVRSVMDCLNMLQGFWDWNLLLRLLPTLSYRRSFSISLSSYILPPHCISICSDLLLTNVRKQGLRLKHKIFLVNYAGRTDTLNVCPSMHMGWPDHTQHVHNTWKDDLVKQQLLSAPTLETASARRRQFLFMPSW